MEDNVVKNGILTEKKRPALNGCVRWSFAMNSTSSKIVIRIGTPPKCNIDTKNDDTENVSPFKYGYFGMSVLNFGKANI